MMAAMVDARVSSRRLDTATLGAIAESVGFELVGIAPVEPVGAGWYAPHAAAYEAWLADGHHAGMAWLAERATERLMPRHLMPSARSAAVFWLGHRTPEPPRPDGPHARVAAYAWGRDYHNVVRKALRKVLRRIIALDPSVRTYMSIDTGAVLERAFGARGGVGWIGKSGMLIHPRRGTFGSLAVMFLDRELEAPPASHPDRCGTCDACITACPTGAIVAPGRVDARLCISYWTIEHRGLIPVDMRRALGDWVFGCDICQDVCPWNRDAPRADPARWRPVNAHPDPLTFLTTPEDTLEASLEGSPFLRARVAGLRRNALVVLANQGRRDALSIIEAFAAEDPDPVLRATATWAARVLGSPTAAARAATDPDPVVRAEADVPIA
jgi:epoxyqueuosine reductase